MPEISSWILTPSDSQVLFVTKDELVGTLVVAELLLCDCYDLVVVRLRLLDHDHMEGPIVLFVTSPLSGPAFQLKIETLSALAESCPRPVSESILHVGEVIVRRQDTSRTRIR